MPESNEQSLSTIQEALGQAIGPDPEERDVFSPSVSVLSWLVQTGDVVPPWWSRARDRKLGQMWKESNHLALAVYNTQAKMVGIPFHIEPIDFSVPEWVDQAEETEYLLNVASDFGRTWQVAYAKFIEDLLTQDNGAFMEVIGQGPADGPIIGAPISIRHLDSARCTRTGNPVYPVVYMDEEGLRWKLHFSRVIYMAQMPSAREEMYGVGLCAISRSVEIAQTLLDMVRYKQERLGSRPHNQMLVGQGIEADDIMAALRQVDNDLSNRGFSRYARTVALGSQSTDIDLKKIDLNHMDPFDEETSTNLGMFAIASAFGMDADELWPTSGRGSSRGEANLRRMRSRGRLPAQLTRELELQFGMKFLPNHLKMRFDFRDDEEDQQRAVIRDIRGRNRERDLSTGALNIRAARLRMLADGDIDRPMFEDMELADGRLPDGRSVAILFYEQDPVYERSLRFIESPLSFSTNDVDESIASIQEQRAKVLDEWARTTSRSKADRLKKSYFALDWLEEQYAFAGGRILPPVPMQQRRQRTDIRVEPLEMSQPAGEASSAQQTQVQDENVPGVGGA